MRGRGLRKRDAAPKFQRVCTADAITWAASRRSFQDKWQGSLTRADVRLCFEKGQQLQKKALAKAVERTLDSGESESEL